MTDLATPPSDPVVAPPARRPGSVRRTSTVQMSWPGGLGTPELYLQGRARDLFTPLHGAPQVLAAADLDAVTGRERDIQSIDADPAVAGLQRLVGVRAGSGLPRRHRTGAAPGGRGRDAPVPPP